MGRARVILGDMVRAIRAYRPLVVLTRFTGTPADGHGQHQLAGKLTPLAFAAAADPAQFPEQLAEGLRPWQAKKLYVGQGFGADPGDAPTLRLPTGTLDPRARPQLRRDRDGGPQPAQVAGDGRVEAPRSEGLEPRLVRTCPAPIRGDGHGEPERSVFDGIDTSLTGLPALAGLPAGALSRRWRRWTRRRRRRCAAPTSCARPRAGAGAARGLAAARAARTAAPPWRRRDAPRPKPTFLLAHQGVAELDDALVRASGLVVDALADRESAAPGEDAAGQRQRVRARRAPVIASHHAARRPAGRASARAAAAAGRRREPARAVLPRGADAHRAVPRHGRGRRAAHQPYWLRRRAPGPCSPGRRPGGAADAPFDPPTSSPRVSLPSAARRSPSSGREYRYADRSR